MMETPELRQAGARVLGHFLAEMLALGWSHDDLDKLDALWREHYDENGNLTHPRLR